MRPSVVSASKSGAVSLMRNVMVVSLRGAPTRSAAAVYGTALRSKLALDCLVMPDHLAHNERQEFLGKIRIQLRLLCERSQPRHLLCLPRQIGGRQSLCRLELAHCLGELEALGQQVHQRRVDIVDGIAQALQFGMHAFPHLKVPSEAKELS